ncbi:hypothetical protein F442_16633 [Phytophthora nicotianae P10297]|uniref:Uncharacterized protein n=2 Tax=Phytophthora nicotianae TaxID=4792 RepID=W2YLQ5_PHYNI|nr:hypothetical protein L917_16043 [Phytophthora nicotianae]ETP35124.1 hypothetical protein F442_16633 [Phytophthora nicotianae P10297]
MLTLYDSETDLNTVEEAENPDDFGGLEPGNEVEEKDIVDTGEEDGHDDTAIFCADEDEDNGSDDEDTNSTESNAEHHFAEKCLESIGGLDRLLTGTDMTKQDVE